MANEKTTLMDFDSILKEEAERHNLEESELRMAVREELTAQVAKRIVERIIAGEIAPPTASSKTERKRRVRYALGK